MEYTAVGKKIRELRRLRGLSQMKLAEKLNLSYQQLQKYENGRSQITLRRLEQLSAALGVPITAFLPEEIESGISESPGEYDTGGELTQRVSREEAELLELYRRIGNRKIKEGLLKQLKGIVELENRESKSD